MSGDVCPQFSGPGEWDGPPPLPSAAEIAPGYRVVGILRRGRDLDVYDLWSEHRGCRCIGKTVRPDRLESRGVRARLLREGKLLLRLTHPHIVRAYEVQTSPTPLVILETLPGETLSHLIDRRQRRLSTQDAAQLGLHLCSAVGYLHRNKILHLDLKPSNIIATNGMAKVLDLSIARAPGRHRGGIGTTGYMAPEQARGGVFGPATDVWGIGVTLYEVMMGEPACEVADETTTSRMRTIPCRPRPIRRLRRIPRALASAIDHALSQDPADRPSVDEFSAHLGAFIPYGQEATN
jgi:eukaryotic-like serine/threonine-protein kinase